VSAFCPNCGVIEQTVAQQIGGKITFAVAAAALGRRAAKNPLVTAVAVLGGVLIGHFIDQEISKRCPQCGAILQIARLLP